MNKQIFKPRLPGHNLTILPTFFWPVKKKDLAAIFSKLETITANFFSLVIRETNFFDWLNL